MGQMPIAAVVIVVFSLFSTGFSLRCWHCSSDVDPLCHDHFNVTEIMRRDGRGYSSFQDQQYDPNRRYDPNQRYDPYNQNYQGYNRQYNSRGSTNTGPRLDECNDEEARIRGKKNVCLKKVQKLSSSSLSVIRRCDMIALDKDVSTCYDSASRGVSLEFCEYCDYDGCNAATSLKVSYLILGAISGLSIWMLRL